MLKLRRLCCTCRGFDMSRLENVINYLQEYNYKTTCIPHHFLYRIPSLEDIAQFSSHSLRLKTYFYRFLFFNLMVKFHGGIWAPWFKHSFGFMGERVWPLHHIDGSIEP
jgi:predicted AlkP superfamily pyrophosphatase or phosphodiesterase